MIIRIAISWGDWPKVQNEKVLLEFETSCPPVYCHVYRLLDWIGWHLETWGRKRRYQSNKRKREKRRRGKPT